MPGSSVSQVVHNAAGTLNGIVVPAAALFCFFHLRKTGRDRFAWYSLVSAIVGMVFLVLIGTDGRTRGHVGLFQRLSFGTMRLWLGALAASMWGVSLRRSKTEVR